MFSKKNTIHLIGGGGVGMSALGLLLLKLDFKITASDLNQSVYLEKLSQEGAETWTGSCPERIKEDSVIFYSTAIPADDPERKYAGENEISQYSRHPLLEFLTKKFYTIAISGTHGKTTVSAWAAFLLREAGLDPTIMVGGSALDWQSNFIKGEGNTQERPLLVMEADESDNSFTCIHPMIGVVTNIEMDHPDQHDSLQEIEESFITFISNIPQKTGLFVVSIESEKKIHALEKTRGANFPYHNQKILNQIKINEEENSLIYENKTYSVGLRGLHNLYNATCVLSLGELLKIDREITKRALLSFSGVARRMQIIHEKKISEREWIHIMDDYAHHPREIISVLDTLKKDYDHILAVWEPHRISRFCYFFDEFSKLWAEVHEWKRLILLPTFMAGDSQEDFPEYEGQIQEMSSKALMRMKSPESYKKIYELLHNEKGRRILVFLGAGNSSLEARRFVDFSKKSLRADRILN